MRSSSASKSNGSNVNPNTVIKYLAIGACRGIPWLAGWYGKIDIGIPVNLTVAAISLLFGLHAGAGTIELPAARS